MIIEIVSKTNSYVINGVQVEKGRLNISVSDGVVTVNNVSGTLDEVSINGNFYASDDLFITAADELLFNSGGGSGEGAVNSVTGNLVSGTASDPVVSISGTNRDIVTFDDDGNPDIKPIGVPQLTDVAGFPPFANGVLTATAMNSTTKTGLLSFIEFSTSTPKVGTFATYGTGGVLAVGSGVANGDAVNVGQLNSRIPTGGSATTFLRGDGTWITPTNTTYTAIAEAEATTGSATTVRGVSAASLKRDILNRTSRFDGFISVSTSRDFALTDASRNKSIVVAAPDLVLTIPAISWVIGDVINIINGSSTNVTITPSSGVTLIANGDMYAVADKAAAHLIYIDVNTWFLEGELTTVV